MASEDPIPALKNQLRERILADVSDWPQQVAAGILHLDQPRMSDLERGRLERFGIIRYGVRYVQGRVPYGKTYISIWHAVRLHPRGCLWKVFHRERALAHSSLHAPRCKGYGRV